MEYDLGEDAPDKPSILGKLVQNRRTSSTFKEHRQSNGFILCEAGLTGLDPRTLNIDIGRIAASVGSQNTAGSVAVGALLELFGMDLRHVLEVIISSVIRQFVDINLMAVTAGYNSAGKAGLNNFGSLAGNNIFELGA